MRARQGALSWYAADHGATLETIGLAGGVGEPLTDPAVAMTVSGSPTVLRRLLDDLAQPEAARRFDIAQVEGDSTGAAIRQVMH